MYSALALTTLLFLLLPALISAQNFKFTGPNTANKLDLSSNVLIQWNKGKSTAPQLDLLLSAPLSTGVTQMYPLVSNLTLATGAGSYTWDPRNVTGQLTAANATLSGDRSFVFVARLHAVGRATTDGTNSGAYAVTGYGSIAPAKSAATGRAGPSGMALVAGVGLLAVVNACWL